MIVNGFGFNRNSSARWCELDSIGQQVPHHLLKSCGVARYLRDTAIQIFFDLDIFCCGSRPNDIDRRLNDGFYIRWFEIEQYFTRYKPRCFEQFFDQLRLRCCVAMDGLESRLQAVLINHVIEDDLRPTKDRIKRRS